MTSEQTYHGDGEPSQHLPELSSRRSNILNFIRHSIVNQGQSPTFAEIADGCGYASRSAARKQILKLVDLGYIDLLPNVSRSIRLLRMDNHLELRVEKPAPATTVEQWLGDLAKQYGDDFTLHLNRDGSGRIKFTENTHVAGSLDTPVGPMLRYRVTLSNEWNYRNLAVTVTCQNRQEGIAHAEDTNPGWTFVRAKKLKEGEE